VGAGDKCEDFAGLVPFTTTTGMFVAGRHPRDFEIAGGFLAWGGGGVPTVKEDWANEEGQSIGVRRAVAKIA